MSGEDSKYQEGDIISVDISKEMKKSYLDYAMSVIVARAIPDVCDGLKPVHRRIFYSMYENGYEYNKPFKKCARIVGDVMGKYHPHGDTSIYEALVRMAQDFSMSLPLIDGQGNFGSIDDDPPAAMRYTEARMKKISNALVDDLDKDTVDFFPNYDGNEMEPNVLPAKFPNILVNGTAGIAVGMATNIPPHNLGEIIDAVITYIENRNVTVEELLGIVPAPDFPTDCLILGRAGYINAARTGRGSIIMRGKTSLEEKKNRAAIIIESIPYQVNKAKLVEKIAELVKEKRIEGITDLRDESNKDGIRIVIELKKDAISDVILNQLYSFTELQTNFPMNMLALNKGKPELMNLLDVIKTFAEFRESVVTRRTEFLLKKDREKAHLLVGLKIAVSNIDEIVKIIRESKDTATAKRELMLRKWNAGVVLDFINLIQDRSNRIEDGKFYFSEEQAKAILDMRLSKLTGLESEKIDNELREVAERIREYLSILGNHEKLMEIIKKELTEIKETFAVKRRSQIIEDSGDFDVEDLTPKEDMVVITTMNGYIKRVPLSSYRAQNRGGKGKIGISMHDEDLTTNIFVANTHTPILFFSTVGKVYRLKTYKLPLGANNTKGRAMVNLLPLEKDEKITTILPLDSEKENWIKKNVVFATKNGNVRRNLMEVFENVQSNGKIAIKLDDGDKLTQVALCEDDDHILLSSKLGKCIRFPLSAIRIFQGRSSSGVRGIRLEKNNEVVSMSVIKYSKIESIEKKEAFLKIPAIDRISIKNSALSDDMTLLNTLNIKERIPQELLSALEEKEIMELAKDEEFILTITENGYGKRTSIYEYRTTNRGGIGITNIITSERNGAVVFSNQVSEDQDVMMITDKGVIIRTKVKDIRISGRNTQGVTLMRTEDKIISVTIAKTDDAENDDNGEETEKNKADGDAAPGVDA
ncbi:MAG: DNA gyrase subunit A [Rickettsiales bacterium]|jgi:DNA gyrase subunit A|nr:DNA gyrase subunit A [Rickettsiales bacterium]